jgi:radical SAM protein with 4Fe4S-binding SPASM domain
MIPAGSRTRDTGGQNRYVPRGLLLQWHVTERCNLRCAHCYQDNHAGGELAFPDLLGILDQYVDLMDRWRRESSLPVSGHITVTGGEPFIRPDFLDFLEILSARRDCFSFAILTNGSSIDAPMARHLKNLRPDFVQLSLEGSQRSHDWIRGEGNFERTVKAAEFLVWQRIPTLISFTAHRYNFREFGEVARLGQRLRVTRVWADRLIPRGTGSNLAEQVLTPEETREFLEIMHRARTDIQRRWLGRTEIAMHRALAFLLAGGTPYHCTAGDALITVMPNGDVYPCRRMPVRIGNLLETPLTEIYYRSDFLQALRDRSRCSDGCEGCSYVGLCRGGLKCLSYALSSDPFKADPGCWLAKH